MKQKLLAIALPGAIIFSPAALSETTSLEEVVVTAARMPQPLDQAIAHTTVLNEQDIRNSGAPDVQTLLRSLAGIEVVQNGGLGKQSSTFMRGTNSSHVLVLLDGVRINSATVGISALEHIMLDNIERIEVVRGNFSSLYGSEAIGGVIQLFTRRGRGEPALNAGAGLGSHGAKRVAAGYSGSVDATSFSINAGKHKTRGISAVSSSIVPTVNPDKDGYDNTTFSAQVQHAINADQLISASVFNARGDSQYDNAFGLTTDRNNTLSDINKLSLSLEDQLSTAWHSKLNWARGTDDTRDILNDVENSRFKTTNDQLVWQNELQLADTQRVNLAFERLVQSVSSDTQYTRGDRSVNSMLASYLGEYGTQQVQLNLHQDRYSDFGTVNTGLIGYGLAFADDWRITASASNAFKAPTFNDMYYPLTWGFSGNPNLRPEHSRNNEIGLHYSSGGQRIDAVYFDNHIRDLIAINGTFSSMVNINQARINGWELGYAAESGDTRLKASATFQNPRDSSTGKVLLRRARHHASITVTQNFGSWEASGELQHSGLRHDADINTFAPVTLPGYRVVNLNAHYRIDKSFTMVTRLDNLFNRDYMLTHGYNSPGRTFFVEVRYH